MNPKLSKQEKFIEEYLIDLNATQAAIRAGYSKKTAQVQSSKLLSKAMVQQKLKTLMDKRSKKTEITAEYVLSTIRETIERCKQAEPVMEFNRATKTMEPTGEWQFKEQGVLKGCELLGKHLGLYLDKIQHTGAVAIQFISDEEAESIANDDDAVKKLRAAADSIIQVTKGKK